MKYAIQWILSLIFIIQMYLAMVVFAVAFFIPMLVTRRGAFAACMSYAKYVRWTAKWIVGLESEVRGTPPTDEVLVAAKHQSFFDIIFIFSTMPKPKFIMKRELLYAPILGQYAYRMGCVPVSRGKRAAAVKTMIADVKAGRAPPGQLCIYPQGTRVPPGVYKPYKVGTGILYRDLGQDCVPVAVNVGLFWPKRGIYRKRGTAVIEFLPRIEKGQDIETFMEKLETVIETNSDRLMDEARGIK